MKRRFAIGMFLMVAASMAIADTAPAKASLSADEIVRKNLDARGGQQAWRSVQTMTWSGKLGAGGNQRAPLPVPLPGKAQGSLPVKERPQEEAQLPFVMEMARGRKVRLEIQFNGKTAVQVFDGVNGWKFRPFLNRLDVEPYTAEEAKAASVQEDIDGPLSDYAAKGTRVELAGVEKVDGRENYKLKLTFKNGQSKHLWIDGETFLETKIEGNPRRLDGKEHAVEVYYLDYRKVDGLQIPFLLETHVLPVTDPGSKVKEAPVPVEKIAIEKAQVNPKIDLARFAKPQGDSVAASK